MKISTLTRENIKNSPYGQKVVPVSEHSLWHNHTFWEITFVVSGSGHNVLSTGETLNLVRGVGCIMRPNDIHNLYFDKGTPYCHYDLYIYDDKIQKLLGAISPNSYNELKESKGILSFNVDPQSTQIMEYYLNNLFSSYVENKENKNIHSMLCMQFLTHYFTQNYLHKTQQPDWIISLTKELSDINMIRVPISEIIKKYPFSQSTINKNFVKYTGKTLQKYRNEAKIAYAAQYMLECDPSIAELSELLGYDSPKNFIKQFKMVYNMTPRNWFLKHT